MLSKLTSNQKILLVSAGLIIFIALSICVSVVLFFKPAPATEESTPEPIAKIEYCGTTLNELCLLSFGRNVYGNAIINLFVPDEELPDFYLRIVRANNEIIYICMKNEETPSTVVCMGDALNLGERVEINVMFMEDYQLFAQGIFTVKAILISPPEDNAKTPPLRTATPVSGTEPSITGVPTSRTESPTPTPEVSYPSYP